MSIFSHKKTHKKTKETLRMVFQVFFAGFFIANPGEEWMCDKQSDKII
jgi:hypothetical protein